MADSEQAASRQQSLRIGAQYGSIKSARKETTVQLEFWLVPFKHAKHAAVMFFSFLNADVYSFRAISHAFLMGFSWVKA